MRRLLERVRHRLHYWGNPVAHHIAALRQVMELHRPVDRGRVMNCCAGCEQVNGEFHDDCCHEWPCPTYEAVAGWRK